jgi:hypothetical protein
MRNAIAAVAAADNWRNVLREPFESISSLFIRSSSNVRVFSMERSYCFVPAAKMPGLVHPACASL